MSSKINLSARASNANKKPKPMSKGIKRQVKAILSEYDNANAGIGQLINTPAASSRKITAVRPQVMRSSNGVRIRSKELIADSIAGSTSFTVQVNKALNPGLASVFPCTLR